MSMDRIKELLGLMKENDLVEIEVEEGDFYIRMKKPGAEIVTSVPQMAVSSAPAAAAPAASAAAAAAPETDPSLTPIPSPIVGTYYAAPSPDAPHFVEVGATVTPDTVVCIVEAMKIMNEVKAGVSGTIEKIMAENGDPVEYGQPLFLVR